MPTAVMPTPTTSELSPEPLAVLSAVDEVLAEAAARNALMDGDWVATRVRPLLAVAADEGEGLADLRLELERILGVIEGSRAAIGTPVIEVSRVVNAMLDLRNWAKN